MERKRLEQDKERELASLLDESISYLKTVHDIDPENAEGCINALAEFKKWPDRRTISGILVEKRLKEYFKSGASPFEHVLESKVEPFQTRIAAPRASESRLHLPAASVPKQMESTWLISMSREFLKAINGIDRKLQGRVLTAVAKLTSDPMTPQGDSVKPLSREMNGLWRYRLGDYRLVYQPIPDRQQVLLLNLASRGSVYD